MTKITDPHGLAMPLEPSEDLDGVVDTAPSAARRIVIYGVQGIGKTTLAAQAPSAIFLPIEDGLGSLRVKSFGKPDSFLEVMNRLRELYGKNHSYRTLVIDTLDALEGLVWADVCHRESKPNVEAFGYGKGYAIALQEWRKLLGALDKLREKKSMTIVLIAHSHVVRVSPPDGDEYDRYSLKLHKSASALVQEWADAVLFARYETRVIKEEAAGGRRRARGIGDGERVLETCERPAWAAKNRFGLDSSIEMEWSAITAPAKGTA